MEYLNKTVWATLAPSTIHGIGVFAIRDIPKGTEITDFNSWDPYIHKIYEVTVEEFLTLHPAIQALITKHTYFPKGDTKLFFPSPNAEASLQSFMNHSLDPNTDGKVTIRDIAAGEELTENYYHFYPEGIHKLNIVV